MKICPYGNRLVKHSSFGDSAAKNYLKLNNSSNFLLRLDVLTRTVSRIESIALYSIGTILEKVFSLCMRLYFLYFDVLTSKALF